MALQAKASQRLSHTAMRDPSGVSFPYFTVTNPTRQRLASPTVCHGPDPHPVGFVVTAGFASALFDSGVQKITSIDHSATAISLQSERNVERAGMKFQVSCHCR